MVTISDSYLSIPNREYNSATRRDDYEKLAWIIVVRKYLHENWNRYAATNNAPNRINVQTVFRTSRRADKIYLTKIKKLLTFGPSSDITYKTFGWRMPQIGW